MAVAVHRPLRGSRVSSFYPVKTLPSLSSLDSAFQLQEYISLLIRLDVHDVDSIVSLPGKATFKDTEEKFSDLSDQAERKPDDPERKSDIAVDRGCWIYEQLRYFCRSPYFLCVNCVRPSDVSHKTYLIPSSQCCSRNVLVSPVPK